MFPTALRLNFCWPLCFLGWILCWYIWNPLWSRPYCAKYLKIPSFWSTGFQLCPCVTESCLIKVIKIIPFKLYAYHLPRTFDLHYYTHTHLSSHVYTHMYKHIQLYTDTHTPPHLAWYVLTYSYSQLITIIYIHI